MRSAVGLVRYSSLVRMRSGSAGGTAVPEYLKGLPVLKVPRCLGSGDAYVYPWRSMGIQFGDVPPGTPLWKAVTVLSGIGVSDGAGKIRWAVPGVPGLVDYGVERTGAMLKPSETATVGETLRMLLLFSCRQPKTVSEVRLQTKEKPTTIGRSGPADVLLGKRLRVFADGAVQGVQLQSRLEDAVLSRQQQFDLGLLTYAGALLRDGPYKAEDPLTVRTAARLISSLVLFLEVDARLVEREPGFAYQRQLEEALVARLLGLPAGTRSEEDAGKDRVVSRGTLLTVLAEIVGSMKDGPGTLPVPSRSEVWWVRVR